MTKKNITPYESLALSDRKHLLHPQTNIVDLLEKGPKIIASGKGVRVKDARGHELIDGMAGLWCVNIGYGRDELAQAMADAARNLSYFHSFTTMSNPPEIALAEKLAELAPGDLEYAFFGCSGSDANDTLIKIIWHYHYLKGRPEKKKLIARTGSYHGTSVSTASLTGLTSFHKPYNLPIPEVRHTGMPHYYRYAREGEGEREFSARMAAELDALIEREGPETVAAFFAEPVSGAGGVVAPPAGYFEAIQKVLEKHDVLMVADEVITAFGRLGAWFGSEVFNIKPGLMATAKGLTSGYFPLSAALIPKRIWEVLREGSAKTGNFAHGYTYSGHPVGCAVALKNLEIIERENLVANAAKMGEYLHRQLNQTFADHPHVGEVRGKGLIAAVQLVLDRENKAFFDPKRKIPARIAAEAYKRGLIVRPLPTVTSLALSPPLVITEADIDQAVEILKAAIDAVMAKLSGDDKTPAKA